MSEHTTKIEEIEEVENSENSASVEKENKPLKGIINSVLFDIKGLFCNYTALIFIVLSILSMGIQGSVVSLIITAIAVSIFYYFKPKSMISSMSWSSLDASKQHKDAQDNGK
ncbi:MAG: hypothetical protein O2809_07545 [Proteobacteria bacterium]|nr:hypothetical protein [Pseudomonadota bacterium]